MAYRWKPTKTQRQEFALKMQDPEEREAYETRKRQKAEKHRSGSQFNYESAGGHYVPTKNQYDLATSKLHSDLTREQEAACRQVISGHSCNEKIHHDHIHIVNELL